MPGSFAIWRHTGFSVHNRVRVEPEDGPALECLARYIMRPPISLERVQWSGDGEVSYRPKGGHDGRAHQPGDAAEVFDPAEFLARVIMHIPEPSRHLVRYYGEHSNVSRGKRRRQVEAAIGVSPCDSEQAPSVQADRDRSPDARALRPILNLVPAAADRAGCARRGGCGVRDWGSMAFAGPKLRVWRRLPIREADRRGRAGAGVRKHPSTPDSLESNERSFLILNDTG